MVVKLSFTHCKVFRDDWKSKMAGYSISNCLKSFLYLARM